MKRLALLLSLLLPLAACQKPAAPNASAPANAPATTAPSAAAEAAAAAANSGAPPAASTASTPAPAADPGNGGFDATTGAAGAEGALVPGTDYVEIKGGQPYAPLNGKIEVVQVFSFICPACNAFEPLLSPWVRKLPADVRMTYVPADFNVQWRPYAQAFVVANAMGLDNPTSHQAMYDAIHVTRTLPGEGQTPDPAKIAAFYAKYGADPKQFLAAMTSFSTTAKLKRNQQFLLTSGVEGTPTLIVNGKYRVTGKSFEDMLRVADLLIARQRAANAAAPGAAAGAR